MYRFSGKQPGFVLLMVESTTPHHFRHRRAHGEMVLFSSPSLSYLFPVAILRVRHFFPKFHLFPVLSCPVLIPVPVSWVLDLALRLGKMYRNCRPGECNDPMRVCWACQTPPMGIRLLTSASPALHVQGEGGMREGSRK